MSVDLLLCNGRVITMNGAARAEALAIAGDRIVAIGTNAELEGLQARRTIDLAGRTVIPGINDAHAHMDREGLKRQRLSLAGAKDVPEILARIRAAVAKLLPGDWLVTMPVGDPPYFFDGPKTLAEGRMPTLAELDNVAPLNPVCIPGLFGNWGKPPGYTSLNTLAMQLNNITASTQPRVKGIEIVKDANGEPTGLIIEHNPRPTVDFDLLKAVPRFSLEERIAGLAQSLKIYNAVGTTSVYEGHGVGPQTIAAYRDLWEKDALTVRSHLVISPTWADVKEAGRMMRDSYAYARGRGLGDAWLNISGIHIALGGDPLVAELARADLPNTGWAGFVEQAVSQAEFRDYCFLLAQNDIRLNTIVADRLADILPILEEVASRYPLAAKRWVIQHIAKSRREDLARLKALGCLVTTIPVYFLWKGGHWYFDDPQGGDMVVPHRDLIDLGVPTAAATDNIPYDPFVTIWAMMVRSERTTGRVLGPRQALNGFDAQRLMTAAGAMLSFEENVKGQLRPGFYADLAVLDSDPTELSADKIRGINVDMTIVGGRIVHGG
jgi:predicted amidohydrolase YtcJ